MHNYIYLKEVQEFLDQEGHVEEAFKLGSIIDKVSFLLLKTNYTRFMA